jgi:two-component system, sensor histidine kinase PhcS
MPDQLPLRDSEFQAAFLANERQERINTGKVASALVFFLMPFGSALDFFLYHDLLGTFLVLRLICSALAAVLWYLHTTPFGRENYKLLGLPIALLPAIFIAMMIYMKEGPTSPYYAGLNLILLAVSVVVHWSTRESLLAVMAVLVIYLTVCVLHVQVHPDEQVGGIFYSNVIFMIETGIIVVVGNYIYNRLRFREFALRYELAKNKKTLEQTNQKLDHQNKELADAIHKLTEAESQLVQSEKMASLGRMSAGIIHEINNPLNFAITNLFTLRKKGKHIAPEHREDYEEILKDVEDGISRVKNIVSDLRLFTHPDTEGGDEVNVSEVVTSALRFVSNELKDKVSVEVKLPKHQMVCANKKKLIHVLVNLIQNSLDAMQAKSFNGEKPTIWIEGRVENGASYLVVRDNGTGIESQHLDKIFDPFFTTKDVGEGMGLGLSICYRIIQESQGRISVRTEPGKFCEFTLEFPTKG